MRAYVCAARVEIYFYFIVNHRLKQNHFRRSIWGNRARKNKNKIRNDATYITNDVYTQPATNRLTLKKQNKTFLLMCRILFATVPNWSSLAHCIIERGTILIHLKYLLFLHWTSLWQFVLAFLVMCSFITYRSFTVWCVFWRCFEVCVLRALSINYIDFYVLCS